MHRPSLSMSVPSLVSHRPLSSPPANSPPAYHPSPLNGLSRLSGTASTGLTSLPPSSAPGSPKPFTAAQKGKGKASAPTEPRVVRARRSTASLGMAVGMGGMGGIGDRKEIEELVWECRDRMGKSERDLWFKRSAAEPAYHPLTGTCSDFSCALIYSHAGDDGWDRSASAPAHHACP